MWKEGGSRNRQGSKGGPSHGPSQAVVTRLVENPPADSGKNRDGFFLFSMAMLEHIRGKMTKAAREQSSGAKKSKASIDAQVTPTAVATELARIWAELGEAQKKSWRSQASVLDSTYAPHSCNGACSSADSSVHGEDDDNTSSPPSDSSARSFPSSFSASYLSTCSTASSSSVKRSSGTKEHARNHGEFFILILLAALRAGRFFSGLPLIA